MGQVLVFFLLLLGVALPVQAQVTRCTSSDGRTVYTDYRCTDIGANQRPQHRTVVGNTLSAGKNTCARDFPALASALAFALHSDDVNRLASLYDWGGIRSAQANRLLDRLQAIVSRNLIEIQPQLSPAQTDAVVAPGLPASPPRVVGLRAEQVMKDGISPAHADFAVHRRMGCWWLQP